MATSFPTLSTLYNLYSQTSETALHSVVKPSYALWNGGQYQYGLLRKAS